MKKTRSRKSRDTVPLKITRDLVQQQMEIGNAIANSDKKMQSEIGRVKTWCVASGTCGASRTLSALRTIGWCVPGACSNSAEHSFASLL